MPRRCIMIVVPVCLWLITPGLITRGHGQLAVVLTNTGGPLKIPYACAEEDLQRAGMDCSETSPCPVYLELSAAARNGRKIFVGGNLHTSAVTLVSVLLMSDDSGASWKEPAARIPGAAIDQLQFFDLEHAWAAGETQDPLPRDPFFLVSSSGGDSWRKRPVREEGAVGSIQSFRFDSPVHGELIIDAGKAAPSDRYLSYETETGGESWTIRSTSRTLPALADTGGKPQDSDLRIQTGSQGKVWELQQQDSGKWPVLVSFLVQPAMCGVPPAQ